MFKYTNFFSIGVEVLILFVEIYIENTEYKIKSGILKSIESALDWNSSDIEIRDEKNPHLWDMYDSYIALAFVKLPQNISFYFFLNENQGILRWSCSLVEFTRSSEFDSGQNFEVNRPLLKYSFLIVAVTAGITVYVTHQVR